MDRDIKMILCALKVLLITQEEVNEKERINMIKKIDKRLKEEEEN